MSLFGLLNDVVEIATAPVKIASNVVQVVTKPLAKVAEEIVKETKDWTK